MGIFESQQRLNTDRKRSNRRRFLAAVAAGVGGYFAYSWWRRQPMPLVRIPHRYITPNRDFYTVSIGGYPEKPDLSQWRLSIRGPAGEDRLSYADLKALPSKTLAKTFMCISNRVGGDAIGNAEWTVTALAPLLRQVAAGEDARWRVGFYALDGFYSSVPLPEALDSEAYLAYQMNGVPLPREHGFPVRVLLPGVYGMKQPRWLDRIEVTDDSVSGYWERRGWSDTAKVKLTSRIDDVKPVGNSIWRIQGIAYGGGQLIGAVEVSIDDGPWRSAALTATVRANAWTTWELEWEPEDPGSHLLAVRAIDSRGQRQEEAFSGAFPSGATGMHRVIVRV